MAAKDRYSFPVKCPKCGLDGTIDVSENDYPFTPPETKIESIHGNFTATQAGGTSSTIKIACGGCGASVPH
jgi:endogenous inhibitor of DNA gyrase (YacG/DUF329 family)